MTTCTVDDPIEWPRGTTDYLEGTAYANVDLAAQPVAATFDRVTFIACSWTGSSTYNPAEEFPYSRTWRTTQVVTDADLPAGITYEVFIRITDNPEISYVEAGTITFT